MHRHKFIILSIVIINLIYLLKLYSKIITIGSSYQPHITMELVLIGPQCIISSPLPSFSPTFSPTISLFPMFQTSTKIITIIIRLNIMIRVVKNDLNRTHTNLTKSDQSPQRPWKCKLQIKPIRGLLICHNNQLKSEP